MWLLIWTWYSFFIFYQKELLFTGNIQQNTFTVLPQGYVNSPVLFHKIVQRELDEIRILPIVIMVHCIDNITLI